MRTRRDNFTVKTARLLRNRVAGYCSNPECKKPTVGPAQNSRTNIINVGVAAHIKAAASEGPRYDINQSSKSRKSIDNGIWLCQTCSRLVDVNDGKEYSAQILENWKYRAEKSAHIRLQRGIPPEPLAWVGALNQHIYVNVPRVISRLEPNSLGLDLISDLNSGFPEGNINDYLIALRGALASLEIDAIPIELITNIGNNLVGSVVSFDSNCRTKNYRYGKIITDDIIAKFNSEKSPYFYIGNKNTVRWLFPYDPKWITTTTAHTELSSGSVMLAGLGTVKRVMTTKKEIVVSPLVVGTPRRNWHEVM